MSVKIKKSFGDAFCELIKRDYRQKIPAGALVVRLMGDEYFDGPFIWLGQHSEIEYFYVYFDMHMMGICTDMSYPEYRTMRWHVVSHDT